MTAPCKTCRRDNEDGTHTALEAFGHLSHEYVPDRPEVVVLCGSTRFFDEFRRQNLRLTIEGKIVLSIGCDTKSDGDLFGTEDVDALKHRLDELHKRKIDLADRVLVLNVGGYIGESTRSEIAYAQRIGRPVEYLEADNARRIHDPGVHQPFNDDGATYCGWAGDGGIYGGCGEVWPCSANPTTEGQDTREGISEPATHLLDDCPCPNPNHTTTKEDQ